MTEKVKDHCMKSLLVFYSELCNTILEHQNNAKSVLLSTQKMFDYINTYCAYTTAFLYLEDTSEDLDSYTHDCYVITKDIIDNSELSSQSKNIMSTPLNAPEIYQFPPKAYKLNHLKGLTTFLVESLRIVDEEDKEPSLIFKELMYPFYVFILILFPLEKSATNNLTENIAILRKYLTFQINLLHDSILRNKLISKEVESLDPHDIVSRYIAQVLGFMYTNNYAQKNIDYAVRTLKDAYNTMQGKKYLKIDKIINTIDKVEIDIIVDKPEEKKKTAKKKVAKKKGEPNVRKSKPAKKRSTNTAVSRKGKRPKRSRDS